MKKTSKMNAYNTLCTSRDNMTMKYSYHRFHYINFGHFVEKTGEIYWHMLKNDDLLPWFNYFKNQQHTYSKLRFAMLT